MASNGAASVFSTPQSPFNTRRLLHLPAVPEWSDFDDRQVVSSAAQLHGWNAQAGVNVGVQVNVPMPTAEERAERKAIHAKLDEIFRLQKPKE